MKVIYHNKIILFLLILAFFKPICFQYYSALLWLDILYDAFKIAAAAVIVIQRFTEYISVKKLHVPYILVFSLGLWGVVATLLNQGFLLRAMIDFGTVYSVYVLITSAIKYDAKNLIVQLTNVLMLLVTLQLASELFYNGGLPADLYVHNDSNPLYFVTLDNGTASLTVLTTALLYMRGKYTALKSRTAIIELSIIICMLTAGFSGSTTAIACTVLAIALPPALWLIKRKSIVDKPYAWICIYIGLFFTLVFGGTKSILHIIMEKLTGKTGFTGRTHLWDLALSKIAESPIIGYGRQIENYLQAWGGELSSHNVILELLLQGGAIAAILWFSCILISARNLRQCKDRYLIRLLLSTMFLILLALMMEVFAFSVYLFIALALMNSCLGIEKLNQNTCAEE